MRGASKVILLENVEGLKYAGKDEGLRLLLAEPRGHHQQSRGHIVRAFGRCSQRRGFRCVPQVRERVFVVAHRDGRSFTFPKATNFPRPRRRICWTMTWSRTFGRPGTRARDVTISEEEDLAVRGKAGRPAAARFLRL